MGELWGGAYDAPLPVPPHLLCLAQFADEAAYPGALVFIGTTGGLGGDGDIQVLLDSYGVPYTGVGGVGVRFTHRGGGRDGRGLTSMIRWLATRCCSPLLPHWCSNYTYPQGLAPQL